jgi:hypothetical protein
LLARVSSSHWRDGRPEVPAKRTPARSKFAGEVASGDRRRALVALRDRLVAAIEETEGFHVAPLAKQLSDVLADLDKLREPEVSARDDLASRRTARRAAAQVQGGAAGGDVGGPRGG